MLSYGQDIKILNITVQQKNNATAAMIECEYFLKYISTSTFGFCLPGVLFQVRSGPPWACQRTSLDYWCETFHRPFLLPNQRCQSNNNLLKRPFFSGHPGKPVSKCHHSGFYWSKDNEGGDDNHSSKTCKAPELPSTRYHQQCNTQVIFTGHIPFLLSK